MKFEAECKNIRRMPGDEVRFEASFLVNCPGWPGWLIIRVPSTGELQEGSKIIVTVEGVQNNAEGQS